MLQKFSELLRAKNQANQNLIDYLEVDLWKWFSSQVIKPLAMRIEDDAIINILLPNPDKLEVWQSFFWFELGDCELSDGVLGNVSVFWLSFDISYATLIYLQDNQAGIYNEIKNLYPQVLASYGLD